MATEAQTLANRLLGRRIVLYLGHFDFEIVSDFDIRISDFNHSGCFMRNKPNLPNAQIKVTSFYTVDYEKTGLSDKGKTNPIQTQYKPNTKPIQSQYKANTKPIQSQYKPNLRKAKNERNFYFNKGL